MLFPSVVIENRLSPLAPKKLQSEKGKKQSPLAPLILYKKGVFDKIKINLF